MFGYDDLRAEQKRRREAGDRVQLGIGISTFTEMCGLAPSRVLGSLDYGAGGWEHASVRMLATGKVEVVTGASAHGQGHETAFSQIVADRLGVPFEDVEVLHGDTAVSHKGLDTYGSRSLVVGGEALVKAVDKVIAKATPIAAHLLEASVDDIEFSAGRFSVRGTDQGLGIADIALATFAAHNYPEGIEPNIDAEATYDPVNFNFPHGTHLCAMEVDTETGQVTMRKYVCCDDIGNIINPLIVSGQVHGGLVQGIAQALWEEAIYDDSGTLVSGSFVDYLLPTSADTISFDIDHTTSPSTTNTLGTKGVGEAGTIASTPAVVNAVVDAIRHLGVNDITMPCTPERVWKAINTASAKGGATEAAAMPHFDADEPGTNSTEGAGAVIPAKFDYLAPTSVEDALSALAEHGDDAKIMAGGQSLLPVLRMRLNAPEVVIDIGRIDSLRGIRDDGDAIVIGALTTHSEVVTNDLVQQHVLLLSKAAAEVADNQIRHRGTFGGALAHADPAGDMGACRARTGRRVRDRRLRRHPDRRGRRLLRRPLRDRDRRGRDPHRDPGPEAHRLGRPLREVRPGGPPVADRRGRRHGEGRRRHDQRGEDRAHQHGLDGAPGLGDRGGPGGRRGHRGRRTRGCRPGGRRHQPAERPERRLRLPQAPRDGAHAPRRAEGGRGLGAPAEAEPNLRTTNGPEARLPGLSRATTLRRHRSWS